MTSLNNKTALVTGSARGSGERSPSATPRSAPNVVINYSTGEAQVRETVAAIEQAGGTVLAVQANVASAADVDRLFASALDRFGSLDIVVANAGVELIAQLLDVSEADFDRLYSINAKGAFLTLQRAARHVADNGRIVYRLEQHRLPATRDGGLQLQQDRRAVPGRSAVQGDRGAGRHRQLNPADRNRRRGCLHRWSTGRRRAVHPVLDDRGEGEADLFGVDAGVICA